MRKALVIIMLLLPGILFAQTEEKKDVWEPFRYFIGSWAGTSEGIPGSSELDAHFKFVLNEKYLEARYKAVFPPNEKNPKGEIHEDFGFISYDTFRNKFVYRQFNIEGFVNQYVLDSISDDGKTIVFITESVEKEIIRKRSRMVSVNAVKARPLLASAKRSKKSASASFP